MRASEFIILLENRRNQVAKLLGDRLVQAATRDRGQTLDEILNVLEAIDTTKNKNYLTWLANQYIRGQYRLEDANRIKNVLVNFERLKPRLTQRNIEQYDFYQLEDAIDKITNPELGSQETATAGTFEVPADAEVLYNGPLGLLAIPKTEEASCQLGSGTKWCTAGRENNQFSYYSSEGPLYIWRDRSGAKYQFHFPTGEFMDSRNRPIDQKLFNSFRDEHPVLSRLFKKEEKEVLKDPTMASEYADDVLGRPWPEAELAIAQDPAAAYNYAFKVLFGPWPEAEPVIARDPTYAYHYAHQVLGRPWPEGEPAILRSAQAALDYAKNVLKKPWPEAEPVISRDPSAACNYARDVLKRPWPEAEPVISRDPWSAYIYARYVLKRPWPPGEPAIALNPHTADYYSKYVLKRP